MGFPIFKGSSLFRVRPSLLWSTYFLKGACGVNKDFAKKKYFFYGGLFFKGAPLFRVRPSPLRYVLSSTDFSKGACGFNKDLVKKKKNFFLYGLPYSEYVPSLKVPTMEYVLFKGGLLVGSKNFIRGGAYSLKGLTYSEYVPSL